ncbi:NAD-dependent succinate-semialdehyde dehydrogenase [Flammeovirgaceae bacterium SG7u.111]|nr:NAD-dependent succinate-semialdehyde dehydrogenase [Flammeovirgaceae bacterium SG7u.132]WPO33331.1 NAD-dependent succinate-semialdehyde dehydrogenase [Flammeovirgaceae bacterium SG7u.111]
MKTFYSINPYNQETISEHVSQTPSEVDSILTKAEKAFQQWRFSAKLERVDLLKRIASILNKNKETYALTMSLEMGKPLRESIIEIEKSAWGCEYYAEKGIEFLEDQYFDTRATTSFVRYEPLGTILAIMPWNFPFWQFFRFAAPNLMAGNNILLKHAPNVFGCAKHIADILAEAGLPEGVFHNLFIDTDLVPKVIEHKTVKAVTLTGSTLAGSKVAELAGKNIKKSVLELGGNNAFIVLDSANLDDAIDSVFVSRMRNSGQSCIAAKRILLQESIKDEFLAKISIKMKQELQPGNPIEESTTFGTLARIDLADKVSVQVTSTIKSGAKLLVGGEQKQAYFAPTILDNVQPNSVAFEEEVFGPVISTTTFGTLDEAVKLANQSNYGLGTSIYTEDIDLALHYASKFDDGSVFINELVRSDPRLPFGGTKTSGYGRELALEGIREFVNTKTIYVK